MRRQLINWQIFEKLHLPFVAAGLHLFDLKNTYLISKYKKKYLKLFCADEQAEKRNTFETPIKLLIR